MGEIAGEKSEKFDLVYKNESGGKFYKAIKEDRIDQVLSYDPYGLPIDQESKTQSSSRVKDFLYKVKSRLRSLLCTFV